MTGQVAQFTASLGAVVALVLLVHFLGFSKGGLLGSEAEAREMLRLAPGGFEPIALALDSEGSGAIARDRDGRIALLAPHGGQFVARVLLPSARLSASDGRLTIVCKNIGLSAFTLRLGDSAGDWAAQHEDAS
ncbi:MAG: hypothetical protein JY451_07395 [Erythrobacter sp.]|nr:MAG: hypothetical protein JY451_07395 [Erythrobacter sp.]